MTASASPHRLQPHPPAHHSARAPGRHLLVALPLVVALGVAIVSGGAALASSDAGAPAGSFTRSRS